MFAYAAGWSDSIEFIGRLYVAELVAIFGLFFVRPIELLVRFPALRTALLAYGLMLTGFMLSDFINGGAWVDRLKGWANPALAGVQLVFVFGCLSRRPMAVVTFLATIAITKLIFGDEMYNANLGLENPSLTFDFENMNYFKVRFVPFLVPMVALASMMAHRVSSVLSVALLLGAGVVFMLLEARSSGLVLLLAGALTIYATHGRRFGGFATLVFVLGLAGVAYAAYSAFVSYTLTVNPGGHTGIQLSRLMNPYNPFALLSQGRSEWGVALIAISDRPIFGFGSWAMDVDNRYGALRALNTYGMDQFLHKIQFSQLSIPAHSVFLISWLWGGVVSAAGAIILLFSFLRAALGAMRAGGWFLPAICVFFLEALWAFFFSPIGAIRLGYPFSLALLLLMGQERASAPSRLAASLRPA